MRTFCIGKKSPFHTVSEALRASRSSTDTGRTKGNLASTSPTYFVSTSPTWSPQKELKVIPLSSLSHSCSCLLLRSTGGSWEHMAPASCMLLLLPMPPAPVSCYYSCSCLLLLLLLMLIPPAKEHRGLLGTHVSCLLLVLLVADPPDATQPLCTIG